MNSKYLDEFLSDFVLNNLKPNKLNKIKLI